MAKTEEKKIYYVDEEFDFESIMREFGSGRDRSDFDYDSASDIAYDEIDNIIGTSFSDSDYKKAPPFKESEAKASDSEYTFDAESVRKEFDAEDNIVDADEKFDADAIRLEFGIADEPEDEPESKSIDKPVMEHSDEVLDEAVYNLDDVIADINAQKLAEIPETPEVEEAEAAEEAESELPEPTDAELLEQIIDDFSDGTEYESTRVFSAIKDEDIHTEAIDEDGTYADGDIDFEASNEEPKAKRAARKKPASFRERVVTPFISAAAFIALKIQQSKISLSDSLVQEEDLGEEMAPDKASKFYTSHLEGLRLRTRIAFALSFVLIYISFGLPVAGAMNDISVKSAVCLILLISVMIAGLDIITSGIMALVKRRPHANSLIALSALFCVIDGFVISAGMKTQGLPFCAIPALTISFSLLGSIMNCRSSRIVFNTVSSSRKPYTVTAETSVSGEGVTILKSRMDTKGFVRRTEEAGPDETVYSVMAPFLIIIALLFSIISAAVSKSFSAFAHILSGIFVCAAPVAMLLTFPLPNFVSAKSLIRRGSAIAGWSGLYDLGKCRHMIITDSDLFPKENIKISRVRIFSGLKPEKVVSLAGSIIAASGSVLSPAFTELMIKGKGSLLRVENFECHEGGGLVAMVNGVEVYCGSASFMHLMGVHLPEEYKFKNCIYISEGAAICGMFEMTYTADESVKQALYTLMQSERHPIFAVRDFNITPQLLSVKYEMATDGFDFPSYAERYELSGAEPSEDSKPAALVSREGLGPFIDLAEHAKSLYTRIRICVMLSVLSTVIGILLMFILSLTGAMSIVTALIYLIVWLIPIFILSFTGKV